MRLITRLFFLFLPFLLHAEESIHLNNVHIYRYPNSVSRAVPPGIIPESSQIIHSTELRSFGIENSEISVILKNPMNTEQLLMYYEVLLKGMEWKILQKEKKENKTILLAESQVKKIVTLIIYPDNEFSLVKIFLRRNYNF